MKQLVLFIAFCCSALVFSQNSGSINGKIIDSQFNNEPLAFATVAVKGQKHLSTSTEIDGSYALENLVPGEYTIVFSFVGYETIEKTIVITETDALDVTVTMKANSLSLNPSLLASKKVSHTTRANSSLASELK